MENLMEAQKQAEKTKRGNLIMTAAHSAYQLAEDLSVQRPDQTEVMVTAQERVVKALENRRVKYEALNARIQAVPAYSSPVLDRIQETDCMEKNIEKERAKGRQKLAATYQGIQADGIHTSIYTKALVEELIKKDRQDQNKEHPDGPEPADFLQATEQMRSLNFNVDWFDTNKLKKKGNLSAALTGMRRMVRIADKLGADANKESEAFRQMVQASVRAFNAALSEHGLCFNRETMKITAAAPGEALDKDAFENALRDCFVMRRGYLAAEMDNRAKFRVVEVPKKAEIDVDLRRVDQDQLKRREDFLKTENESTKAYKAEIAGRELTEDQETRLDEHDGHLRMLEAELKADKLKREENAAGYDAIKRDAAALNAELKATDKLLLQYRDMQKDYPEGSDLAKILQRKIDRTEKRSGMISDRLRDMARAVDNYLDRGIDGLDAAGMILLKQYGFFSKDMAQAEEAATRFKFRAMREANDRTIVIHKDIDSDFKPSEKETLESRGPVYAALDESLVKVGLLLKEPVTGNMVEQIPVLRAALVDAIWKLQAFAYKSFTDKDAADAKEKAEKEKKPADKDYRDYGKGEAGNSAFLGTWALGVMVRCQNMLQKLENAADFAEEEKQLKGVKEVITFEDLFSREYFEKIEEGVNGVQMEKGGAGTSDIVIIKQGADKLYFKDEEEIQEKSAADTIRAYGEGLKNEEHKAFVMSLADAMQKMRSALLVSALPAFQKHADNLCGDILVSLGFSEKTSVEGKFKDALNDIMRKLNVKNSHPNYNLIYREIEKATYTLKPPCDACTLTDKERNACLKGATVAVNSVIVAKTGAFIPEGGSTARRNVLTTKFADMLGIGDMVAKSRMVTISVDGKERTGIVMEEAKGMPYAKLYNECNAHKGDLRYSNEALKQMNNLRIFDLLCGQVDRNYNNIMCEYDVTDENGKMIYTIKKIKAIDNDMSFGKLTDKIDYLKYDGAGDIVGGHMRMCPILDKKNKRFLPRVLDGEFVDKILAMTPVMIEEMCRGSLSVMEIAAMKYRLASLQKKLSQKKLQSLYADEKKNPNVWQRELKDKTGYVI